MKQDSLPGYKSPKKIKVIESGGIKSVLVNDQVYMSWQFLDETS